MTARLFLAVLLLAASGAVAEVRAVVVGVGDYRVLDADLRGPPRDAALMAEVLLARGVDPAAVRLLGADILPDGVRGGAPTRAGILAALAEVAGEAQAGDTVVFYFSGHGAQAPDTGGDEGGGSDEILLPADAEGWTGAAQAVTNAILDDELQVWAAGLLGRGVAVVGVIDACHAATGFRAVGGAGVARSLSAADLGIPASFDRDAGAGLAAPLQGEFVFLYAAQSDQRAFEYPVGDSGVWHGAFTVQFAEALRRADGASWAQVLAAAADGMVQGPVRQDPAGEGPMLNRVAFGTGDAMARFALRGGVVQAGLLQGVTEGSTVALYAGAAGGVVLGQRIVTRAGLRDAALDGDVPVGAAWAEVVAPATPPLPGLAAAFVADGAEYVDWIDALAPYVAAPGDLVPILTGGQVALAGSDGVLDPAGPGSTPRIAVQTGETETDAVARVMGQAAHALRLRKLFAGSAGRSLTGKPVLQVAYARRVGRVAGAGCGAAGAEVALPPGGDAAPCDQIWLTVTNRSSRAVDLSVLYFNADFTIAPIWPQNGLANRLAPGEAARVGLQIAADAGFADEDLMILGVPVEAGAGRVDLTLLAEPGVVRGGAVGWFAGQLDGTATRGFTGKPALSLVRQVIRVRPMEDRR